MWIHCNWHIRCHWIDIKVKKKRIFSDWNTLVSQPQYDLLWGKKHFMLSVKVYLTNNTWPGLMKPASIQPCTKRHFPQHDAYLATAVSSVISFDPNTDSPWWHLLHCRVNTFPSESWRLTMHLSIHSPPYNIKHGCMICCWDTAKLPPLSNYRQAIGNHSPQALWYHVSIRTY